MDARKSAVKIMYNKLDLENDRYGNWNICYNYNFIYYIYVKYY